MIAGPPAQIAKRSHGPRTVTGLIRMRIRFYVPCLLFEREVARNWRRYVRVQQHMRPALMGRNRNSLIDHVLCCCVDSVRMLAMQPRTLVARATATTQRHATRPLRAGHCWCVLSKLQWLVVRQAARPTRVLDKLPCCVSVAASGYELRVTINAFHLDQDA